MPMAHSNALSNGHLSSRQKNHRPAKHEAHRKNGVCKEVKVRRPLRSDSGFAADPGEGARAGLGGGSREALDFGGRSWRGSLKGGAGLLLHGFALRRQPGSDESLAREPEPSPA